MSSENRNQELNRSTSSMLWHYTTGQKIPLIETDGLILTSPNTCGGELQAVWFSRNPVWEKTSAKGWYNPATGARGAMTMQDHEEFCGGLFRIGVAPQTAPHDWNAFRKMSGILPKYASGLRNIAYGCGARISDWFVSFDPVPRSKWLCLERWENGVWCPHAFGESVATAA
jgi:hypothetical protein